MRDTMPSGIHRRVTHRKSAPAIRPAPPGRIPDPAAAARPPPRSSRVITARRRSRQAQPFIASAGQHPHGRGSWPGGSRHVPRDRKDQAMGPDRADLGRAAAGHDPDGRRASGHAGRRPGGGHAGGGLPLAALLRPLTPAATRTCSRASGRRAARPAPALARFLTGAAGSRGVRAAGTGRPEVPARPGPAGCPRAGRAAPGRARSGPSGTTAADAQAAINSLPRRPVAAVQLPLLPTRVRSHADTSSSPATTDGAAPGTNIDSR